MFSAYGGRLGHTLAILQTLSLTTIHSLSRSYSLSRVFSSITSPPKRVGTHNGSFHCDEAFGCFLIRLTDKFSGAQIVQTRDAQHYGLEIIPKELKLDEGHQDVHRLYLAVYKNFIEAVDALDNGINQYDTDQLPRYVNNTNLTSRVERLNADWADFDQSMARENEALTAVVVMKSSL